MKGFSDLPSSRYVTSVRQERYDRGWILVTWVGRGKRVLELGCSTGFISQALVTNQCEVTGVEIDEVAARKARKFCKEVIVTDLSADDWTGCLNGQTFDVILMGDVLEHLVNPDKVLRTLRPLLRPSGFLLISLPNIVHWFTRMKILLGHFDYQEQGTLDCTHLRFFTPRSAQKLIEEAGFKVTGYRSVIGGRFTSRLRPAWQCLANWLPNLFAYQLFFEART
jgi:2-polyprenyl-3-methyl-5-hydroxy-6-metoxy-1,4-benzoquinol methylase